MAEAGQRQLLGAHGAARRVGGLEHEHRAAGLGEADRGGQPVRARCRSPRRLDHVQAIRSASWCSMLDRSGLLAALAPERVLRVAAGEPRRRLLDVPGHRIPRAGGPHPRLVVVDVEQQPVVARCP